MKLGFALIGGILLMVVLGLALELGGVAWYSFIEPKKENAKRKVFENTESYIAGSEADLGKTYGEYMNGDAKIKDIIAEQIKMRYPNLEASKLQNNNLANFLTKTRGY